jgi:hypothetical protein
VQPRSSLIWSPIYEHIKDAIASETRLLLVISPFIKCEPLGHLIDTCRDITHLKVVVRWTGKDLLSGASDVGIYPLLTERGIQLFFHPAIHLKLFVFDGGRAFHTSGNITQRGLGLAPTPNIEVGCDVRLSTDDWKSLYRLLAESSLVDQEVFEIAKAYVDKHSHKVKTFPPIELTSGEKDKKKAFSRLSLPASNGPTELFSFYCGRLSTASPDTIASCMHDLILYDVPEGLSELEFFERLGQSFRHQPFIRAVTELLRKEKSARFGLVTEWLQRNCSDKPMPYRFELKDSVRKLYEWLTFYFVEISWNQPHHSMIIYWRDLS